MRECQKYLYYVTFWLSLMEDIEYISKTDRDINSSTSRINDDPSVVSSLFWEGNISDKLSIKSFTESNGSSSLLLKRPFENVHLMAVLRNNKIDGKCTVTNKNGVILGILTFVEGIVTGPCTLNNESGKLYFKGRMEAGCRQGRGTEYDEFGNVIFDGFYDKGTKLENIVPLEEMNGYWKEYNSEHKLVSISQRDDFGRKEGICYFYDNEEKINRISEWKEDKEISTSVYCEIYDEPRKLWRKGYFDNRKRVFIVPMDEKKQYWKEYGENNELVSIFSRDIDGNYNGMCYLYYNEKLSRISYWEHGKEVRVLKQFNGLKMTEFDEEGHKCYVGEYLDSMVLDYPRHGIGEEYDTDEKTLRFKGNYHNGRRHGKGTSYKNNEVCKKSTWMAGYSLQGLLMTFWATIVVLFLLLFVDVILGVVFTALIDFLIIIRWSCSKLLGKTICNRTDLKLMADYLNDEYSKSTKTGQRTKRMLSCFCGNIYLSVIILVSFLLICICTSAHFYYNSTNTYVSVFQTTYTAKSFRNDNIAGFRLSFKPFLKTIEIENQCFEVASVFQIKGLSSLNSVKIGSNSFTGQRNNFGSDGSKSFHVLNCKNLQSIEIGEYSFSDFGGKIEIRNLPSLKSLVFGVMNKPSLNFYSVKSFLIEGMKQYSIVDN